MYGTVLKGEWQDLMKKNNALLITTKTILFTD